jgi:hypothetical protein
MDIDMKHVLGHAAWTRTCSDMDCSIDRTSSMMDKNMQYGHKQPACTGTCSIDMDMQYEHILGNTVWTSNVNDIKTKQREASIIEIFAKSKQNELVK